MDARDWSDQPLPAALAAKAAACPEDPWLFYPRIHGWHWHSWKQVADRVARGAAALRASGALDGGPARIAFADRLDPDSVAAALAIRAAGGLAVALDDESDARLEVGEGERPGRIVLPPIRSRLERWTPDLEPLTAGDTADDELSRAARRWGAALAVESRRRPIVLASAHLGRRHRHTLLAWTLAAGAAWALEADPEEFVSAALWTRPTHVVAPGADAALLAAALRQRRHRRWHRLRIVGLTDGESPGAEDWGRLGVALARI